MKVFFGGAGWKLFYLIGVSKFLQENFNLQGKQDIEFHGASSGAWVSMLMALNFDCDKTLQYWITCAENQRKRKGVIQKLLTEESLKGMFNLFNINESNFIEIQNKVHIYTTSGFLKVKHHNNIKNKKDLYTILMGSTYIPLVASKKKFKYQEQNLYDGAILELPFNYKKDLYISTGNYGLTKNYDLYPSKYISGYRFIYPCNTKYALKLFKMGYKDAQKLLKNPKLKSYQNNNE